MTQTTEALATFDIYLAQDYMDFASQKTDLTFRVWENQYKNPDFPKRILGEVKTLVEKKKQNERKHGKANIWASDRWTPELDFQSRGGNPVRWVTIGLTRNELRALHTLSK